MSKKPLFVVSLDFELFWGMFDKVTLESYGENVRGVHSAIPQMLALFERYKIHATWASVGLLMCEDKSEMLSLLPGKDKQPQYSNMSASSYSHIANANLGQNAQDDPYHYGAHLVQKILSVPHQELASHTFSHFYILDEIISDTSAFAADCGAFANASRKFNTPITSIVFPRNQLNDAALRTAASYGFTAYRGNPPHMLYSEKTESAQTNLFLRALRLIDAYLNISGHHTYMLSNKNTHGLCNVPASRFLRPYTPSLRFLEKLRIARIKKSMTHAAKYGEIFHLWWHPHNFGINRKENLGMLIEILEHYQELQRIYGMESASMKEAARLSATRESEQTA